jgi:hypothetical protein
MESESSAFNNNSKSNKDEKLLGNKREIRAMKENYIFRRILTGKISGKYEEIANTFYHMLAFDWDDERFTKQKTMMSKKNQDKTKILINKN